MKMSENRVIEFLGKKAKAISLMQILSGETNDYPGIPSLRRITLADITKRGFQYYIQVLPEHAFQPHVDAPNHQNPDRQDGGYRGFW